MGVFTQLPVEVLHLIAQHCDQHSRSALSATTRQLHRVCIEELYHTVDLSVHNSNQLAPVGPIRTIAWPQSRGALKVPLYFSHRSRVPLDVETYLRQELFIRTIKEHPEYGQHVRDLHWSVLSPPPRIPGSGDESSWATPWETSHDEECRRAGDDDALWDAFLTFKKVTSIDVAWLRYLRETCPPPPLFTSATSIRLGGQASTRFIAAILDNINPETLVSLSTVNLQEFADLLPPAPERATLREMVSHFQKARRTPDTPLSSTFAGPMHNHLRSLTNRCRRLEHLEIRTYAPWGHWERIAVDDARYEEWAAFIRSVRPTLRSLVFEQHRAETTRLCRTNRSHPFGLRGRPVLWTLFNEHILPVLTDKDAEWPRLEHVELVGFHEITRCFSCLTLPDFAQWETPHLSFEVLDAGRGSAINMWAVRETHVALNEDERKSLEERLGRGGSVELSIKGGSRKFEDACRAGIPGLWPLRQREE